MITNEEELEKIFAMHLHGQIRIKGSNSSYKFYAIGQGKLYYDNGNVGMSEKISNCRLELKNLADISDDDAIEVARIILPLPFTRHTKGWKVAKGYAITGWPYIKIHHNKNVYAVEIDCTLVNFSVLNMDEDVTRETDTKPVDCIDFLRSKFYMLPYKGQSLFDLGIAIKA